jgi:hypothetical protein
MRLQEITAAVGQDDGGVAPAVEADGLDESLLAQMPQVAAARVGGATVVIAQVPRGDDPKRPDRRQGAGFDPRRV